MVYYFNVHGKKVMYEDLMALLDDVMQDEEIIDIINNMYGAFGIEGQEYNAGEYILSNVPDVFRDIRSKYIRQLCIIYNELIESGATATGEENEAPSLYIEAIKKRVYKITDKNI